MPTRNRRRFVPQAIWYFLRQDYPRRELIILDDGEDKVADLVPPDDRIRYVYLDRSTSLTAKRHMGCEIASGDLVAYWDDDDWMASDRLSRQAHDLLEGDADACGAADLLHYHLEAGEVRLLHNGVSGLPASSTLFFRRNAWAKHAGESGDSAAFLRCLSPGRIRIQRGDPFYVAILHRSNAGMHNLADPHWEPRPFDEVSRLLGQDLEFYADLRQAADRRGVAAPLRRNQQQNLGLTILAPVSHTTGYGGGAEYLMLSMARAGAALDIRPIGLNLDGMSPEFIQLFRHSQLLVGAPLLYYHSLGNNLHGNRAHNELFIYTMWEADRFPDSWMPEFACARGVIVPSRFCARAARNSGVTCPVIVVPEGIDPAVYHYEERPERPGITTLMVCPVDRRKNTLVGIEAWKQAFAADLDARLIIKTNYNYHNYTPDDPRITYIDRDERTRGIVNWYRQADVLLALGNEGFGLPMAEALATGLPVIALNSEGQLDLIEDAGDLVLTVPPARFEPYDWSPFGPSGMRGIPAVEDVVEKLRWVAAHREEAQAMGQAAADWVPRYRSVWSRGPAVLDAIESNLNPPRPLRRTHTIWVTTWRQICGVAEYTQNLVENLPDVRVTAKPPDARRARVVHIQHEHGIFNNESLTHYLQEMRQSGVPIAVTEHSVFPQASAWERDAQVLAALTPSGVRRLRARWPNKRVELLPIGCPNYFPPRKKERGRTIASFGFLEAYKGFWKLLDVLRSLPGTDLMLFSHAKTPALEASWAEASAGLPVSRCADFLPAPTVAQRLAASADVVIFWYNETGINAASGAARIALASGVPVLTSPTSWFEDIRPVTYQPADLLEGVQRILEDTPLRERLAAAATEYCYENRWSLVAERHTALWKEMESI